MARTYSLITDDELVRLARSGDHEAFAELTTRYVGLVRKRAGLFQGPGMPERDDLLQEGFLGLYAAVMEYDPQRGAGFGTFAGVCVQNRMADAVRRYAGGKNRPLNESVSLEDAEPEEEGPETLLELRERIQEFQRLLTPLEKKALFLFLSGCRREEIQTQGGMALRTYDNALYRVRHKLKNL